MSVNAAAIRSGRLRVVCAADGARGREVTDEMTVTVECEFRKFNRLVCTEGILHDQRPMSILTIVLCTCVDVCIFLCTRPTLSFCRRP